MSWGGILAWLTASAVCAAVLWAISFFQDFLRAVAAMWRPVALVVISFWLLFLNDQGRELGLSLMGENSLTRIIFLFFALVYWATNNWHSARLGLYRAVGRGAIPVPEGDEIWLYWPPRLLGVCAHLFAAINLSLAAWSQPEFADGGWSLLVLALTAPIAVICAAACVWAVDYRFISSRTSPDKTSFARIFHKTWFKPILLIAIAVIALILTVVLGYAWWRERVPTGFVLGTLSITLSAVAFLFVVSRLRRRMPLGAAASEEAREADRAAERRRFAATTRWLFLIAAVISVCTFFFPMQVGDLLGSMVVAYLAFGAIFATVNWVELGVTRVAERHCTATSSPANRLTVQQVARRLAGYVVAFLLVLALVNAMLRPFHAVRLCDDRDCTATSSPANRLTVQQAAHVWYEQARKAYEEAHPGSDDSIPMLIVAAAGGGIRAAYWTATVLEQLDFDLRAVGGVSPYLFAISGVSGGSVGATAFDAALAAREKKGCKADLAHSDVDTCPEATNYLKGDFLAPALASWIFVDGPSNLLPNFGQIDRGTAIERSFEEASNDWLARPFLSFFPKDAKPSWRPILLLNATHEETGQRAITAHVKVERDVFLNGLDALHLLGGDVRASTAAHNSARFFYVSPAGNLGNDNGSVIDGGYFENYGALSALELSRAAKHALASEKPGIKRVILLISSDPDLDPSRALVRIRGATATNGEECVPSVAEREPPGTDATRTNADSDTANFQSVARTTGLGGFVDGAVTRNGYLNELFAPVIGIQSVREAHGARAAAELATEICAEWLPSNASAGETVRTSGAASVLDKAKQAAVSRDPGAAPVLPNHSYFAHLAMCRTRKPGESPPVVAPLGWVLSQATRDAFKEILHHCDNDEERANLETALGKPQ
jgi:hypothetical protein